MSREDFKFSAGESDYKKSTNSVDQILGETRRVDDALLHALSLVLSSNSEYAKSVSALLESDLSREESLERITDLSKELLENTQKLIKSQEELYQLIEDLNKDHKIFLNDLMQKYVGNQQIYMDQKFEALFENAGLTKKGEQYGPTDKFFLKIKEIFTQEIWVMAVGAIIYHFILMFMSYYKGK